MSGSLAQRLWGIPPVRNNDERDALFPNPSVGQRVDNAFTGTIQRWNGASWIDVYFAGALSTGTPQTLVNDVQILAQPQANNFKGRVVGVADGTTADVTIPDMPIADAGGDVVASPRRLRFGGTGVVVTDAGSGEASVTITAGGGFDAELNGTPVGGPFDTLNVISPSAQLVDAGGGVADLTLGGAYRRTVQFTTTPVEENDVVTGTVALGALAALHSVAADYRCWLTLYATAADRTADAGRVITDDPTTPVLADVIIDPADTYRVTPPALCANQDVPAANLIYYRLTSLEPTSGLPYGPLASDDFGATPPVSLENLEDHAPTDPLVSGWSAWETVTPTRYQREVSDGNVVGTANDFVAARSDIDIDMSKVRLYIDATREATAGADEQISGILHCANTVLGSWDGHDCLEFFVVGQGTNLTAVGIRAREIGGASGAGGSVSPMTWNQGDSKRIICEIDGTGTTGSFKVYFATYGTGGGETLIYTNATALATLLAGKNDANHRRFGVQLKTPSAGTGWRIDKIGVESGTIPAVEINVDCVVTTMEEV